MTLVIYLAHLLLWLWSFMVLSLIRETTTWSRLVCTFNPTPPPSSRTDPGGFIYPKPRPLQTPNQAQGNWLSPAPQKRAASPTWGQISTSGWAGMRAASYTGRQRPSWLPHRLVDCRHWHERHRDRPASRSILFWISRQQR